MPIEDVRAFADWSIRILKDALKKRDIKFKPYTRKHELLTYMIHALALDRRRKGRILMCRCMGLLIQWQ